MRIDACYDSHVHWLATGEFSQRLNLQHLSSASKILERSPQPHHFRGDWLVGFGWDEHGWSEPPHRRILDQWQPDKPVALSRADGHVLWLNSLALRQLDLMGKGHVPDPQGGRIERDATGEPTGLLYDRATDIAHKTIGTASAYEVRRNLLKGVQIFNEAGFTHIRDLTCDETQWNEAVRLDESGLLTLAVEEFFWVRSMVDLQEQISLCQRARRTATTNLRPLGIKIFLDGALGSEGAWLSRCYHGRDHHGLTLWQADELAEVYRRVWEADLELAVHAIGDAAVERAVEAAHSCPLSGRLHLEHAEVIRPETIQRMQGLQLICHMQPAHWLDDRRWLSEKLGELAAFAFPWRRLQEAAIAIDFGSDAPISAPSLSRTLQALHESAEAGLPRLLGHASSYMGHRDLSWAPNSFTLLTEHERPTQVVFRGEHLL